MLSPTFSAVTIDKSILQQALGGEIGPVGEVWSTKTVKSHRSFVYVFVADMEKDWMLRPSDIDLDDNTRYRAYESHFSFAVYEFSGKIPLRLQVNFMMTLITVFFILM